MYDAWNQLHFWYCVLHHGSAHGWKSLVAPSSLKAHTTMDPGDKAIWDAAYDGEYYGFVLLPTWEVISEDQ